MKEAKGMSKGASKSKSNQPSTFVKLICIALFVITISLFSTWGYQSVNYILSKSYNVETGSTFYDLIIGIIAIASSALVFTGAAYIWKNKLNGSKFMLFGGIGFLIKNVLDILNDLTPLTNAVQVTSSGVRQASLAIASDLFQFAFWIFIIIYFNRNSFKRSLS